jgi:uncharacterized protein (DUF983 family)
MSNKSKSQAILQAKCPQCREGDIFQASLSKKPGLFMEVNKHCPNCGMRYEVEPGFFYGAMYISYAFSVAIMTTGLVATMILFQNPPTWLYFAVVFALVFVAVPFSFRYSRVLWLYWFSGVKYQPKRFEKNN